VSGVLIRGVLRSIAVAISIAGVIDPAWSRSVTPLSALVAINLTAGDSSPIERALREQLKGRELLVRQSASHRVPCGPDEDCVLIADGSMGGERGDDALRPMSMIVVRPDGVPNVGIKSVMMASGHQSGSGIARVQLTAEGMEGRDTEVRVSDGAAVVGSASHRWATSSAADVDVPWWPIASGARALRIEAVPFGGEKTTVDNHIDVGVVASARRSSVLVFDARPSWTSTFVRRALEDDGRFAVGHRARVAPALTTGTRNAALDAATLDDISVLIVGGPDALTSEDVVLLDRYVRARGGTVVLLPERRSDGASAPLFQGTWTEHLTASSERVGSLRASEILRMSGAPVTATVMARFGTSPVIVSVPAGNGRVIVSGAMDAWRYRHLDAAAFDRFWRSLVIRAADAGGGLDLRFERTIGRPGSRTRFTLRDRHLDSRAAVEASATARCNDGPATAIRLWPAGAVGEFEGELPAAAAGQCTVEAMVDNRVTTGGVAVAEGAAAGVAETLAHLERQVRASGGVVVNAGHEGSVVQAIASRSTLSSVVSVHPMRAVWWMLPFAACLTAEWWLRRRDGLR
jgi:hypothetical protein